MKTEEFNQFIYDFSCGSRFYFAFDLWRSLLYNFLSYFFIEAFYGYGDFDIELWFIICKVSGVRLG